MTGKVKLGIFGAVVVAGGFLAYSIINKPFKKIEDAEPQYEMTATELFDAFAQDETKANARFVQPTPALILVSGEIAESNTENGVTNVLLKTDNDMNFVVCELDTHSDHKNLKFNAGSKVRFKGLCVGLTMDVVLNRCVQVP
ncbi:MAG: hypothetical protein ABIV51_00240 [Saprospiraceae bacterium]